MSHEREKTLVHATFSIEDPKKIIAELKFHQHEGLFYWKIESPIFSTAKEAMDDYNEFIDMLRRHGNNFHKMRGETDLISFK